LFLNHRSFKGANHASVNLASRRCAGTRAANTARLASSAAA
jgi:hypothetical protein